MEKRQNSEKSQDMIAKQWFKSIGITDFAQICSILGAAGYIFIVLMKKRTEFRKKLKIPHLLNLMKQKIRIQTPVNYVQTEQVEFLKKLLIDADKMGKSILTFGAPGIGKSLVSQNLADQNENTLFVSFENDNEQDLKNKVHQLLNQKLGNLPIQEYDWFGRKANVYQEPLFDFMTRMRKFFHISSKPCIIIDSFHNVIRQNYNAAHTLALQFKNLNDMYQFVLIGDQNLNLGITLPFNGRFIWKEFPEIPQYQAQKYYQNQFENQCKSQQDNALEWGKQFAVPNFPLNQLYSTDFSSYVTSGMWTKDQTIYDIFPFLKEVNRQISNEFAEAGIIFKEKNKKLNFILDINIKEKMSEVRRLFNELFEEIQFNYQQKNYTTLVSGGNYDIPKQIEFSRIFYVQNLNRELKFVTHFHQIFFYYNWSLQKNEEIKNILI